MSTPDALPLGYPTASNRTPVKSQASAEKGSSGAANTGAQLGTGIHAGPRISRRRLQEIQNSLSERDHAILSSVERFRFLTARHLQQLHFADHASPASASRTCRRVLARLRNLRVIGVLDRRIGGIRAGSEGLVYYVDTARERIQRGDAGSKTRKRFEEPSARFLDHTLAIADTATNLLEAATVSGAEVVRLDPEHAATRTYSDDYGVLQVLRPDLYVELAARVGDDEVAAFFVEVDLGHESLPTLLGKVLAYETYRSNGIEQRQFGTFPHVVWAMGAYRPATAERRRIALAHALERNSRINIGHYRIMPLADTAKTVLQELRHD